MANDTALNRPSEEERDTIPAVRVAGGELADLPVSELERELGTSPQGLTGEKAQRRPARYGPNELVETRANPLVQFLSYFWGPLPWMIEDMANTTCTTQLRQDKDRSR